VQAEDAPDRSWGGEFTSVEFGRYCAKHDVHRQLTASYSPQQNGVVERRNQSVLSMARCMLKAKDLPGYFWEKPSPPQFTS
jgi:transposase InsO family protein